MQISIVATISRKDAQELVLKNIKNILNLEHSYEILLLIDNKEIKASSYEHALTYFAGGYNITRILVENTNRRKPDEFNFALRRTRIASNHNLLALLIGNTDYIMCFEDDTVVPENALDTLLEDHRILSTITKQAVGIIEGVEVGRWAKPYVGAWRVDNVDDPNRYTSILPNGKRECEPIDAGGFYCFLVPTKLYLGQRFSWREPVGPDVSYGLQLRQEGYQNYIDWRVRCGHVSHGEILNFDETAVSLTLAGDEKRWTTIATNAEVEKNE